MLLCFCTVFGGHRLLFLRNRRRNGLDHTVTPGSALESSPGCLPHCHLQYEGSHFLTSSPALAIICLAAVVSQWVWKGVSLAVRPLGAAYLEPLLCACHLCIASEKCPFDPLLCGTGRFGFSWFCEFAHIFQIRVPYQLCGFWMFYL